MTAAPAGPLVAEVGQELPVRDVVVTRADLVRYAGASGDFNPIHWNERFATDVGLPDVIAHGMLTMAIAGRVLTDWAGDPGRVLSYRVRFTRPVVVPNDESGATVTVSAKVTAVDGDVATLGVTATAAGQTVLGRAVARVRLG